VARGSCNTSPVSKRLFTHTTQYTHDVSKATAFCDSFRMYVLILSVRLCVLLRKTAVAFETLCVYSAVGYDFVFIRESISFRNVVCVYRVERF
jgi:hypothetical protein